MGRQVMMVPPNWSHPTEFRNGETRYKPMHRETWAEVVKEWKEGYAKWESGLRPFNCNREWEPKEVWRYADIYADRPDLEWWEYHTDPPSDRKMYQPWEPEAATWFQVWETVSEGTPVTPAFATREELVEYLVTYGDFWDQNRRKQKAAGRPMAMNCEPWAREHATKFVFGSGWAPSLMVTQTANGVEVKTAKDGI